VEKTYEKDEFLSWSGKRSGGWWCRKKVTSDE